MSIKEITRLQRIKDKADLDDEQNQIRAMRKPMHFYKEPEYINYDDPSTNASREADEYALIEMRASIAATPKGLTKTMNKKLDRPTEETIRQYNEQHQRKPYVDPDSGKVYKYHPVEAEPVLEQVDEAQLERVLTEEVIARADKLLADANLKRIPQLEELILNITNSEKEIRDEIDSMPDYNQPVNTIRQAQERDRKREEKDRLIEEYQIALQELAQQKNDYQQEIEDIIRASVNYEHEKQISARNRTSNEAKINLVQQQNKQKLKAYKEQLNILNSGDFNMEQMPYETDEEFKERLIAHSQIEAPAEALYDATVYASKEIRNKLKELIRNDVVIDSIANQMTSQQKYAIMKSWGAYRKKFLETLGEYNPAMSIRDLVDFFTSPIGSKKQQNAQKALDDEVLQDEAIDALAEDIIENELPGEIERAEPFKVTQLEDTVEIVLRKEGVRNFFLILVRKPASLAKGKIAVSLEMTEGTFRAMNKGELVKFLRSRCNYSEEDLSLFFKKFGNDVESIKDLFLQQPYNFNPFTSKKFQPEGQKEYEGWGIQHENIPEWVTFGSILINLKKLYYDNLLSIKTKTGHSINGFAIVKVSNKFVSIIMELIRGKNIHYSEIEELPRTEISLYDHLIAIAKLHKKLDNRVENSVKELKHKYEILVGEIEAGNDNPKLIKDLKTIVNKLVVLGVLKQKDANHFIKNL